MNPPREINTRNGEKVSLFYFYFHFLTKPLNTTILHIMIVVEL